MEDNEMINVISDSISMCISGSQDGTLKLWRLTLHNALNPCEEKWCTRHDG